MDENELTIAVEQYLENGGMITVLPPQPDGVAHKILIFDSAYMDPLDDSLS